VASCSAGKLLASAVALSWKLFSFFHLSGSSAPQKSNSLILFGMVRQVVEMGQIYLFDN
jgi:hypothetical protein